MTNQQYYTIAAIADMCISDLGESEHKFSQFVSWALWQYREMHFDAAQEIKGVKLYLSETKTIELPVDYVDWVRVVGIVSGKAMVLDVNDQIPLVDTLRPKDTCDEAFTKGIKDFYHSYGQIARDGVRPWTSKGHFRVDRKNRLMHFTSAVTTGDVYIEYISDGVDPSGQTIINPYMAECLRQYVHFQRTVFSRQSNQYDKDEAERKFKEARRTARSRLFPITIGEYLTSVNLQSNSTPPTVPLGDFSDDFSDDFQT